MRALSYSLFLVLMAAAGCAPKAAPAIPKAPFRGVKLTVSVPDSPWLEIWLNDQRGEWSAETGAEVEIIAVPGEAQDPPTESNGIAADVVIYSSIGMGSIVGNDRAVEVPKAAIDALVYDRKDLAPVVQDHLMAWQRRPYAIPLSAACQLVYYRTDLLADAANQERFEQAYGHALRPPESWREFDELAEFFDGSDLDAEGSPERSVEIASAAVALVCRAAAYGKLPQNFSFYFDVNSMEPRVAGPPFQQALADWVDIAPLLGSEKGGDLSLSEFQAGRTALALGPSSLANVLLAASAGRGRQGAVASKVGCVALPGSSYIYDHDKRVQLAGGNLNRAAIVQGVLGSVLRTSKHPDAGFDFLTFLSGRERSLTSVTLADSGLGPYRQSHLVDPSAWVAAGWPAPDLSAYLSAIGQSLNDPNAVALLRIEGADEYHRALEAEVRSALRGEKPVEAALASAAESWQSISQRHGLDRQRRQYRHSLGRPVVK